MGNQHNPHLLSGLHREDTQTSSRSSLATRAGSLPQTSLGRGCAQSFGATLEKGGASPPSPEAFRYPTQISHAGIHTLPFCTQPMKQTFQMNSLSLGNATNCSLLLPLDPMFI